MKIYTIKTAWVMSLLLILIVISITKAQTTDLATHQPATPPVGATFEWHNALPIASGNLMTPSQIASASAGLYYGVYNLGTCYTAPSPLRVGVITLPATTANLKTFVDSTAKPAGMVITYHTGSPATTANKITDLAATTAIAGTYFAAYYDPTRMCYTMANPIVLIGTTVACVAGTTAPIIIETTVSNTCPATTFSLAGLTNTGTKPTGTSLIWSMNKVPTSAGDTLTNLTTVATGGKYYALYYDKVGNCYSPADSVMATINTCSSTDYDGDGVADATDLDDDNDGILDAIEDPSCEKIVNGSGQNSLAGWNITGNVVSNTAPQIIFNYSETPATGVLSQVITTVPNQSLELKFDMVGFGSNTSGNAILKVDILTGSTVIATKTVTKTFGVPFTNETLGFIPTTNQTTIRFTDLSTVTSQFDVVVSGISINSICGLDSDGDGIFNIYDLDSDGDGCPDAIEGSAIFTNANLVTSSMAGGNAGAGFTGTSSSPVSQNLGNTVGSTPTTLGVPTIANTGQAIGYSQNIGINACIDLDGDGVANVDDLDDDNDGILDTVEDGNCEKIVNGSGENGFTGWTQSGNVFFNGAPQFSFNYGDSTPNGVLSQTITTTPNQVLQLKFNAVGWGGNTAGNVSVRVDVLAGSTVIATKTITKTYGVPWTNETLNFTPTTTQTIIRFTDISTVTTQFDFVVTNISVPGACDLDGDGLVNSLDLDSDGDGCADAIEGGANFPSTNLVASSIAGGNTGSGYTGTSLSPITQNLGNTIGSTPTTLGVPTVANTGQTVNNSQNKLVQSANCLTCVAGTTAPIITETTVTNTCPTTTFSLASLANTGTKPTGTTLVWSTNKVPTSAGDTLTNLTTVATAGKYYALYYDKVGNCYSPADSVDATILVCNQTPVITSLATATTPETVSTTTPVYTATATDPNAGQTQTYSFETGGVDNGKFNIDPTTGVVTFITSPDFETPTDGGANNVYDIKIKVCDNGSPVLCAVKDVAITVTDVFECLAGTTALVLTATMHTNICPITTADISSLVSGTCPAGSALEWHTVATGLAAANKVSTPTAVGAGTYYPVCFDATNACYNPAPDTGLTVSITTCVCNAGIVAPVWNKN